MRLLTCFGCFLTPVNCLIGIAGGSTTIFDDGIKGEWRKGVTLSQIELALEFHPEKQKKYLYKLYKVHLT